MTSMSKIPLAAVLTIGVLFGLVAQAGQARKPAAQPPKAAGAVTVAGTVATPPGWGQRRHLGERHADLTRRYLACVRGEWTRGERYA
jgi:hypothetical protein